MRQNSDSSLSRRDFLKLTGAGLVAGLGLTALRPMDRLAIPSLSVARLPDFPSADLIARNCIGGMINIKSRPDVNSATVKSIYEDALLPWIREVNAENPDLNRINQRWVETPEGYIYSSDVQMCRNLPNQPVTSLPSTSDGKQGFWAEVTVPYVDFVVANPPARSPGLQSLISNKFPTRYYYSQVLWIDEIKEADDGRTLYRLGEKYGSYGDLCYADAAGFRPITAEEIAPISEDVDPAEKTVVVNVSYQTLSCFEGDKEVYFCRVSTGAEEFSTPFGEHITWRKMISTHMAGGTVDAGYDTPGIAWTTLFSGTGVAVHSTFWHNDYGWKRSHGCVNASPEDAKWVFRWTLPYVSLDPGNVEVGMPGGTHVKVEQRLV
jgi:hypothetical protein